MPVENIGVQGEVRDEVVVAAHWMKPLGHESDRKSAVGHIFLQKGHIVVQSVQHCTQSIGFIEIVPRLDVVKQSRDQLGVFGVNSFRHSRSPEGKGP